MKISVTSHIDAGAILRKRGLGDSPRARIVLAETVARLSDQYVPFAPGDGNHMKDMRTVAPDGSTITYHGPYAHYQYVGELMVGEETGSAYAKSGEPKRYTGKPLQYQGAPMRGKEWDKRMMADRGDEVVAAVAKCVGGKPK